MRERKLTVKKGAYGSYKRPVIYLDYNNGGAVLTYEIIGRNIPVEVLERIAYAVGGGFDIEFIGFEEGEL